MIKKTIRYTGFDDQPHVEDFYFHISKAQAIELGVDGEAGPFSKFVKKPGQPEPSQTEILQAFKAIVGLAFGVRTEDGKGFTKSKELSDAFLNSQAYDEFLMEILTGTEDQATKFIMGCLPADLAAEALALSESGGGVKVDVKVDETPRLISEIALPSAKSASPYEVATGQPQKKDDIPPAFQKRVPKPLSEMTDEELEAELAKRRS